MTRRKIDYGIDLGTTNSSIARADGNEITIFKTEPYKKTIMPSCVFITKRGQMYVGDLAYEKQFNPRGYDIFSEFKRTMGSDVIYECRNTKKSFTSEELSAEVLKQLKLSVKDEEFSSSVITVPADFDQVQIEATRRAAEMAGFEYFELLQEPIAASLAFLREKKNAEGIWLVFDFGGGTFDSVLVKMEEGIMKVIDHAGDNHLGGKNMDWLIVDEKIIPHLREEFSVEAIMKDDKRRLEFRNTWKQLAEVAKIALSEKESYVIEPEEGGYKDDKGTEIDTAININRSDIENLISPLIDRAIKICKGLLDKNRLSPSELVTVLMVGGATYIPFLREKVRNDLNVKIDVSVDPLTVVAQGAAIFASTKPIPGELQKHDYSKIQLILAHPDTTVEKEITLGIKVDKEKSIGDIPSKFFIEISRSDLAWTSGKVELEKDAATVRLYLIENEMNDFIVNLFDSTGNKQECEPNSISILQGVKVSQPPLPHDIGVSAVARDSTGLEVMVPILSKGTSLPAVAKKKFRVPKNIRPGNKSDILHIFVWEGTGGTRPIRNVHMSEMLITGEELSSLLPEGSEVEITIRMDESRNTKVSVYLPHLDETKELIMDPDYKYSTISADELSRQIKTEQDRLHNLQYKSKETEQAEETPLYGIENSIKELDDLNEKGRGDPDRSQEVHRRLKELASELDKIEISFDYPESEMELREEFENIQNLVIRYGNEEDEKICDRLRDKVEKVIELKNANRLKDVLDKIYELKWKILFDQPGYWVAVLNNINESFYEIQWSDQAEARAILARGTDLLASGQYSDEIKRTVVELWALMPEPDKEKTKEPRTDIPHY